MTITSGDNTMKKYKTTKLPSGIRERAYGRKSMTTIRPKLLSSKKDRIRIIIELPDESPYFEVKGWDGNVFSK